MDISGKALANYAEATYWTDQQPLQHLHLSKRMCFGKRFTNGLMDELWRKGTIARIVERLAVVLAAD